MNNLGLLLHALIRLYTWVLIIRIVIEVVQSSSLSFRPPRWFMLVAESLFVVTDPPVKLLRRPIPPLRMGNVAVDVSTIVPFLLLNAAGVVVMKTMVGV